MAPKKSGSKGDGGGKSEEGGTRKRITAPAKKSTAKNGASAGGRTSAKRAQEPNLSGDLRQFVTENPHGWGHDEWLRLLDRLRERGHSVDDTEEIGRQLERERLSATLERVQGVGPQRVRAISERYGSIWNLMYADVDDLVRSANIPRSLAERIKAAV